MKKTDYMLMFILAALMAAGIFSCVTTCSRQVSSGAALPLSDPRQSIDIPVLMYHGFTENSNEESEYVISAHRFENDLKWLRENGYTTIFPSQLVAYVNDGARLPSKPVILTFDDGFANNKLYAFPLLEKYNMKAVIALIGSESDRSSGDIYRDPGQSNLTWGETAILAHSGLIEIASHTYDLHQVSGGRKGADKKNGETMENYRKVLTEDLNKNRDLIEAATGTAPTAFAWPYGAYPADRSADPILKDLGFNITFTSYQHTSTVTQGQPDSLFGIGRYLRTPSFDITKII